MKRVPGDEQLKLVPMAERFGHDPHPNTIGIAAMTRAWEAPLAPALAAPSP